MINQITNPKPFSECLSGENAFFRDKNYEESTRSDFKQKKTLPVSYTWNTESKTIRVAKEILSFIIFPIKIYQILHSLVGKVAILPASTPRLLNRPSDYADQQRARIKLESEWKYKRITVEVDGYKIDAMIVGKEDTLNNGRWVLASNANADFYEAVLSKECDFQHILTEIEGNAIVFNYPGVGSSSGMPNKEAMTKAYRAMLTFLEDEKGVGAKEIIGYGRSIGGGVQGEALKEHELKKDISYVFIKDRTFSNLSTAAADLVPKITGFKFLGWISEFLVKLLGWNIDCVESSTTLQAPEIIIQSSTCTRETLKVKNIKIKDDDIISSKAALATTLLREGQLKDLVYESKTFIFTPNMHNDCLYSTVLTDAIKSNLELDDIRESDVSVGNE